MRRGEIELVDPASGRPAPAIIEIHGDVIRIVPLLESAKTAVPVADFGCNEDGAAFASIVTRLRRALTLEQIEEIVSAVEAEFSRAGDIDPPV